MADALSSPASYLNGVNNTLVGASTALNAAPKQAPSSNNAASNTTSAPEIGVSSPSALSAAGIQPNVSSTTLSNSNKIGQVQQNNTRLDAVSNKGISTTATGGSVNANGTPAKTVTNIVQNADGSSTLTYSDGSSLTKYAPGQQFDAQGNPVQNTGAGSTVTVGGNNATGGQTTPQNGAPQVPYATPNTSAEDQATNNILDHLLASTDANTATQIQSIQGQFAVRDQQQSLINAAAQKATNNALLMGGVTGQGSSAQFAPVSSQGIVLAQESYGIQQLAALDAQEDSLIASARQAQYSEDFQTMEKKLSSIDELRQSKIDLANKINDQAVTTNQALAQQALQSNIDNSVASIYADGVTNPAQILAKLKKQGLNISLDQINTSIGNISKANGVDPSTLDNTSKEFFYLKGIGGLPSYIASMPDTTSQLTAFIQAYNNAVQSGKTLGLTPSGNNPAGTIGGYDFSTYATDPNKVANTQAALTQINNSNATATADSMDTYIQQNFPGSPVTGQMVFDAAQKYNVDAGVLAANMQEESGFSTKGLAVKTNNPGNVGNVSPSNTKSYNSVSAGVDATAQWMSNHRAQTPTYGQYGLLSTTDFNPNNTTDKVANAYLTQYLKNGTLPTPSSLGISTRAGVGQTQFSNAQQRANDLYYQATGQNLPSPEVQKANLSLIAGNNKLLNNLGIQDSTVGKNFALTMQNVTANNLNNNIQPINAFLDSAKNALGDPSVARYLAQNTTLQNELGSLLAVKNASGTTVYDKLESAGLISKNASQKQIVGVLNTILQEAQNSEQSIKDQNSSLYASVDPLQQDSGNPNRNTALINPVSDTSHNGISLPQQPTTNNISYSGYNLTIQ